MCDCEKQVYLYFYDELEAPQEFITHLEQCSVCQQRLEFLRRFSQSMKTFPNAVIDGEKIKDHILVESNKTHVTINYYRFLVAAVVLLSAFLLHVLSFQEKVTQIDTKEVYHWNDIDDDLAKLRSRAKRLSHKTYHKRIYKKRYSRVKTKIAKLKNSNIW